MAGPRVEVEVGGRRLSLSNLDKALYPDGTTKASVIGYLQAIGPVLLPHLAGRALTRVRYPSGSDGPSFFEKRAPSHTPDWVRTVELRVTSDGTRWGEPGPRRRTEPEMVPFVVAEEVATLVWLGNLAALELHAPMARAVGAPGVPTAVVFDLDPGAPATAVECAQVALLVKEILDAVGLEAVVKSSGSKGLQLYVPINRPDATFDETRSFARSIAQLLEARHPRLVVSTQRKDLRGGKVLVDWFQNEPSKTTIAVYSLRARAEPFASCPLTWAEVDALAESPTPTYAQRRYDEVLTRVRQHGDLFASVLTLSQELPRLGG